MIISPSPPPVDSTATQILEKVTVLRTRLQLAMHKVETNQTSKPFSRLDKPKPISPELSLPPRLFSANILPSNRLPSDNAVRNSPESQIAANRARAFRGAYQTTPVQKLNSLPMPRIVPTAYSAKYMTQPPPGERNSRRTFTEIPSSPPPSHGSSDSIGILRVSKNRSTPSPRKGAGAKRLPKTPMHQLTSPPGSDDRNTTRRMQGRGSAALTSSMVKGEAANGLLELMRAASR